MISFIKANSNILIFLLLIFFVVDSFLLAFKLKNHLDATPNIKISYDNFKSYCVNFFKDNDCSLIIISLLLENTSTKPIDIINIKLVDGDKSHSAATPKTVDSYNEEEISLINEDESELININVSSENILKNTAINSHDTLNGYAVFENIETVNNSDAYKIVIETPRKTFEKEIVITSLNNNFYYIDNLEE